MGAGDILSIAGLTVEFDTPRGPIRAVDGADLAVGAGEIHGIVGESGSGKTTLAAAVGGLLPSTARIAADRLDVLGRPIDAGDRSAFRELRRHGIAYVFQDPIGSLDPTARIARQLGAIIRLKDPAADPAALLDRVGLGEARRVLRAYPHELSGGMAQRVAIAMAIVGRPRLLIADEPTAALDASIRAQILELLVGLARREGTSLLLLTHDLRSVASRCDRVSVMYAGRSVECGAAGDVLGRPLHPYAAGLLGAEPSFGTSHRRLAPIPGTPPVLQGPAAGCAFAPRCRLAVPACAERRPQPEPCEGRTLLCLRAAELPVAGGPA